MNPLPSPDDIRAEARTAGLSISELCDLAGLHESHFHRWAAGGNPTYKTVQALLDAIEKRKAFQSTATTKG